jgi:hypothetical protein
MKQMSMGVTSILLAIILAAIAYLPVMAEDNDSGQTTITMNTESVMGISLDQAEWRVEGEEDVSLNTTYKTDLPASWCTITNEGNANVTIYIQGEDAKWLRYPGQPEPYDPSYKWTLSGTGDNGKNIYALWYHIKGDTADSYTLVTKDLASMKWARDVERLNLAKHADTQQFGLKLLTPTQFIGGRSMKANITISAVAA